MTAGEAFGRLECPRTNWKLQIGLRHPTSESVGFRDQ